MNIKGCFTASNTISSIIFFFTNFNYDINNFTFTFITYYFSFNIFSSLKFLNYIYDFFLYETLI